MARTVNHIKGSDGYRRRVDPRTSLLKGHIKELKFKKKKSNHFILIEGLAKIRVDNNC